MLYSYNTSFNSNFYPFVSLPFRQQGNTALHLAVMGNYKDLTQALVDAKVEIDLPNHVKYMFSVLFCLYVQCHALKAFQM